jgi:polar amino acid transport system permease protein
MIGFGIPIAGVPRLSSWSQYGLAALALTVLYGAYVAEVYRAGIERIHWSQTAAARSLGLSQAKTMLNIVREQGPPEQILSQPTHPRTQAFLKRIIEAGRL